MAIEYFCAYHSYRDSLMRSGLSHSEIGRLFLSLLEYSETGTEPDLPGKERQVFAFMAADIDRTKRRYAETSKNRSEAAKRGRANAANAAKSTNAYNANENANANDILSSSSAHTREGVDFAIGGNVDPDMDKIIQCYESTIGSTVPGKIAMEMREYLQKMDVDCIIRAIEQSAAQNVRKWSYIKAILSRKLADGVTNIRLWDASEAMRTKNAANKEANRSKNAANKESDSDKIDRIFARMEATG